METWLANARLADSTRAMRKHIIDRGLLPVFRNRLLTEIQPEDLRALCNKVKERGAPATAVQIRDIVKQVYVYTIAHGEKVDSGRYAMLDDGMGFMPGAVAAGNRRAAGPATRRHSARRQCVLGDWKTTRPSDWLIEHPTRARHHARRRCLPFPPRVRFPKCTAG